MRRCCSVFLCLVVLFILPGVCSVARAADGRLRGTVTDQSGAALPGAGITIRGVDGTLARTVVSDARGAFNADAMPEGHYQVTVAAAGFEPALREHVVVAAGDITALVIVLEIGRQMVAVDVTALAPTVESDAVRAGSVRTNDAAAMLCQIPGVSVLGGGGLSSLPAIHGMGDDRVKVLVNGMSIESACANHMNPPLSYIDPSGVDSLSVMAGITPVSRGGDSIGGTIVVDSPRPSFAAAGDRMTVRGSLSLYHRENGGADGGSAQFSMATPTVQLAYSASYTKADNYARGGGGIVKSTFYESTNHLAQLAARVGQGLFTVDVGIQRIPQQGFANARMDMVSNKATSVNGRYRREFPWGRVDARAYYERTDHEMNILRDKVPGMNMPMDTRGVGLGYAFKADVALSPRDTVSVGTDGLRFTLDDWWPPVMTMVGSMGPDTLWNIRNGRRNRVGFYGEWESKRSDTWTIVLGVRSDLVRMNTDNVTGYNTSATTTGSGAYLADALAFNAVDHARADNNLDVTALTRFTLSPIATLEAGYARKTRAPNLYERYLWIARSNMAVQMNGWFGDANGYTGNIDLAPERADTLSATWRLHSQAHAGRELTVTPYYTFVHDYIDAARCAVIAGSNGCTAAKLAATSGFVNLRFTNNAARLYGADVSGRAELWRDAVAGIFSVAGTASYVRGRNLETRDNLYRVMPLNANLTLEHTRGAWAGSIGVQAVAAKTEVQAARLELPTAGYTLVNVRASYRWPHLRLDAGVDNALDQSYVLPLGGRYWIGDTTGASSVPGMGRSAFTGLTVLF